MDEALADEFLARPLSEAMARAIQGAELLKHATPEVVDTFMVTRLGPHTAAWGSVLGSMGISASRAQAARIVERARVLR
ncbi:MAG: hypothetical protein M3Q12_04525 [Pseudomonadota bacterium]|uniref:hypothetical protein n=1 Tax=Polaromonas sp. TaxID=1869339 RepID=UPI0017D9B7F1|nr:hypothetical protein [Polaromonas sp.]MBA3595073.1 hypothetical protein [Polaromonas sp.]MDQ3271421.1 hypothetical protein [Pseudomonadota bacterium]